MSLRSSYMRTASSIIAFQSYSRIIRTFTMAATSMPLSPSAESQSSYAPRYVDIGINLADPIFRGKYHGKTRHPDDLDAIVGRAQEVGCTRMIITGSDFRTIRQGLELSAQYPGTAYVTAGIHPCSSSVFAATPPKKKKSEEDGTTESEAFQPMDESIDTSPAKTESVIRDLVNFIRKDRASAQPYIVAMGEFGLDYDRLHFCSKRLQLASFRAQLKVAASLSPQLPLFLHSRAARQDFLMCMKEAFGERLERLEKGGVVHSFTGSIEEMNELMDLGLHIGINGCSLKTKENCDVVKAVRLDRLMLETDGPWCEVRPSHEGWKHLLPKEEEDPETAQNGTATASGVEPQLGQQRRKQPNKNNQKKGPAVPLRYKTVKKEKWEEGCMIKGRNEPCMIEHVAKIVAAIKGLSMKEVCEAAWDNSAKMFDLGEDEP